MSINTAVLFGTDKRTHFHSFLQCWRLGPGKESILIRNLFFADHNEFSKLNTNLVHQLFDWEVSASFTAVATIKRGSIQKKVLCPLCCDRQFKIYIPKRTAT